jgi:hypothetical protein
MFHWFFFFFFDLGHELETISFDISIFFKKKYHVFESQVLVWMGNFKDLSDMVFLII